MAYNGINPQSNVISRFLIEHTVYVHIENLIRNLTKNLIRQEITARAWKS